MRISSLALAGALALSAAGAGMAQPAPGSTADRPDAHEFRRADRAQQAEQRAERLRAILQLRPDQEPALRVLIDSMRPSAEQMQRRQAERGETRRLPTPERLDRMQARMSERQAQFARRAEAIKRFYAQLTPSQQRAFDAMPMGHRGHDGRGHGMEPGYPGVVG